MESPIPEKAEEPQPEARLIMRFVRFFVFASWPLVILAAAINVLRIGSLRGLVAPLWFVGIAFQCASGLLRLYYNRSHRRAKLTEQVPYTL
jgi:hypothetical protein